MAFSVFKRKSTPCFLLEELFVSSVWSFFLYDDIFFPSCTIHVYFLFRYLFFFLQAVSLISSASFFILSWFPLSSPFFWSLVFSLGRYFIFNIFSLYPSYSFSAPSLSLSIPFLLFLPPFSLLLFFPSSLPFFLLPFLPLPLPPISLSLPPSFPISPNNTFSVYKPDPPRHERSQKQEKSLLGF